MFDAESSRDRSTGEPAAIGATPRPQVGDYVLAMSHELRAPLNAVIGMSGLLLEGDLAERQRQYARSIHSAGESLSTILNDLIDLSRIMADRLPIEPIAFDLRSMVEETAQAFGPRAAERPLALRVDWRPELPRQVVGDPGRTRQVLGNLVGRALNATARGEIAILVAPDGERDGQACVRFSVEDTGIGLPDARLDRIFNEYAPIDASPYRSFGTTGLGLRISAELVRLMGGEIGAESEEGKGSRFWFRLPMAATDATADLVLQGTPTASGGRALIVDTDQASRRRFGSQLEASGWSADFVDAIEDVEERLRVAAEAGEPYRACILSDYAVRPFHAELALRLKANLQFAPVALVMATAVGSPGEGKRLWHAGFTAYLRKPIPSEELADTLVALDHVGPDGRNGALITRHSLAEARQAESATAFDGIDEVLASLTAPVTRQALVLGGSGTDQIEITEALAQCDLTVEVPGGLDAALERLRRRSYEMVIVDADHPAYRHDAVLDRVLQGIERLDSRPPLIAITADPAAREQLLAAGVTHVLLKPIRRTDLGPIARHTAEASLPVAEAGLTGASDPDAPAADSDPRVNPGTEPAVSIHLSDSVLDTVPTAQAPGTEVNSDDATGDVSATAAGGGGEAIDILPTGGAVGEVDSLTTSAEIEPVAATPVGAAIDAVGSRDTPDADQPTVDGTPPGGLVRIDPDAVSDSEPLAGLIPTELESDAAESAVIEPVDLTPHAVAPEGVAAVRQQAPLRAPDLDADGSGLESIDLLLGSTTRGDEPPLGLGEPSDGDPPPSANEPPPSPVGLAVLDLDDSSDEADSARGGEDESPDAVPARGALDLGPTGEADAEEVAFLSPSRSDVEIGTLRIVGLSEADENAEDEPVTVEGTGTAIEERAAPDYATLPVIGGQILEQLSSGSGGFAQHLVATFLREAPQRLAELGTAISHGHTEQLRVALRALKAAGGLLGAARIGAVCAEMEESLDRQDLEGVADRLGDLEHAFLQVRVAVEAAAPPEAQAPAELPAIGAGLAEQLRPDRGAAARAHAVTLADSFRSEAPARLSELTDAIVREDADAVQRIAPALKGMCGPIGADPLAKLCALVEADARLRRIAAARRYVDQLQLELTRVLEALGRAID